MKFSLVLTSLVVLSTGVFANGIAGGVDCGANTPGEVQGSIVYCCVNGEWSNNPFFRARDLAARDPAPLTAAPIAKRQITFSLAPGTTCTGDSVLTASTYDGSTPTPVGTNSVSIPAGSVPTTTGSNPVSTPTSSKNAAAAMRTQAPLLAVGGLGLAIAHGAM